MGDGLPGPGKPASEADAGAFLRVVFGASGTERAAGLCRVWSAERLPASEVDTLCFAVRGTGLIVTSPWLRSTSRWTTGRRCSPVTFCSHRACHRDTAVKLLLLHDTVTTRAELMTLVREDRGEPRWCWGAGAAPSRAPP